MALKLMKISAAAISAGALALILGSAVPSGARADEADAKNLLKAMSDYLAAQQAISFKYDANIEVVTKEEQKLQLASSGAVTLVRPDKLRATRSGGFVDAEMLFDGKTLTLLGKNANVYTQVDVPGTVDHLIDELRDKFSKPLPAADLLMAGAYDKLMADVTDVKDLGSGVIGGVECNWFAFRAKEVDWQIWIAPGADPYPCRYVITTKQVAGSPQFSIQISDWKVGKAVAADDFAFTAPAGAKKIDIKDLADEMPKNFTMGGGQ
jgi:hypothetical protein